VNMLAGSDTHELENDSHLTTPRSFRSLELERIIVAALKAQDMEDVASALRMLATEDPLRAELLYQTMCVGIAIRSEVTS
jgi:hypothetical protein